MKIEIKKTNRGFMCGEFVDYYGEACSIQESSIMIEGNAIWLGLKKGTHSGGDCFARMHLDREMAKELVPLLQRFVKTGWLEK